MEGFWQSFYYSVSKLDRIAVRQDIMHVKRVNEDGFIECDLKDSHCLYVGWGFPITNAKFYLVLEKEGLFDEIIIAVLVNPEKSPFFTTDERCEILREVLKTIDCRDCKVTVESFEGLMVEYATERKAHAIVRGIRAISDYEYELQMALMNRRLQPGLETVFMMPAEEYSYVSSRLVKEVFQLGAPIEGLVPPLVETHIHQHRLYGSA